MMSAFYSRPGWKSTGKRAGEWLSVVHEALPKLLDHGHRAPSTFRDTAAARATAREAVRCADERTLIDLEPGDLALRTKATSHIVLKTVGLAEPLRDALTSLTSAIRAVFVYGSVAKATDQSASDIDLMIISDSLTYGEVFGALEKATRTVSRKVNPTVYTVAEFSKRARTENAFVTRVLEQPKLWVIGSEDDLTVAA